MYDDIVWNARYFASISVHYKSNRITIHNGLRHGGFAIAIEDDNNRQSKQTNKQMKTLLNGTMSVDESIGPRH